MGDELVKRPNALTRTQSNVDTYVRAGLDGTRQMYKSIKPDERPTCRTRVSHFGYMCFGFRFEQKTGQAVATLHFFIVMNRKLACLLKGNWFPTLSL